MKENLFEWDSSDHGVKRFTAYSRAPGKDKEYVQQLVKKQGDLVFEQIIKKRGYFYVCGKVNMAEDVREILIEIFQEKGGMTKEFSETLFQKLKDEGRYAEDIFGLSYSPPATDKK